MGDSKKHSSAWDKVKGVIGAVAPGIATALGGPLYSIAVGAITSALGLQPDQEDEAIRALSSSPDALLKLKIAEIDFRKFLKECDIKLVELDVTDRSNARALAIAKGMFPQVSLSMVYTIGYFLLFFGLMSGDLTIPEKGDQLFSGLIGVLTAAQTQIMNFWFGSSSGSAKKTQILGDRE